MRRIIFIVPAVPGQKEIRNGVVVLPWIWYHHQSKGQDVYKR